MDDAEQRNEGSESLDVKERLRKKFKLAHEAVHKAIAYAL